MAQVSTTKQINVLDLENLLGTSVTVTAADGTTAVDPLAVGTTKYVNAAIDQGVLTNTVNAYVYRAAGWQETGAFANSADIIQGFVPRVAGVLAGTDNFTAAEQDRILAALIAGRENLGG